jgi:hypothetical protein
MRPSINSDPIFFMKHIVRTLSGMPIMIIELAIYFFHAQRFTHEFR